jgi:hypothetical protein
MIGRIAWFTALAAVAVVTAALQVDRQSRASPALAALVPAPLRNVAQARIAQEALRKEDAAQALAEAQRLVRRRPMPAEHLSILAAGQAKAGRIVEAAGTIQVAGQRGWREPIAQEAILRLAIAAGDRAEAARRYAALFLRRETPDALLSELGPAVLDGSDDAGRATMTAIVAGSERWHSLFLQRGVRVMSPGAFAEITARSIGQGAAFECNTLARAIKALAQRDAEAERLLAAAAADRCPNLRPPGPAPL